MKLCPRLVLSADVIRFKLLALVFCVQIARADTVILTAGEEGTIEISGKVVDYTGESIVVQRPGGSERDFPAGRVVRIDTPWPAGFENGRAALAEGDYAKATELLAAAARADQRAWVRRIAMRDLMQCYAAAGDPATTGRLLVELAKSDPTTAALHHAPLAWYATDRVQRTVVAEWWAGGAPVAQLLAASYSLSGSERDRAATELKAFARTGDGPMAQLATMQLWRIDTVTATSGEVDAWEKRLQKMPETLQAGGWLVVGDARQQQGQGDAAALAYLRSSMLANRQPQLAAHSLWQAARVLQRGGQPREASQLVGQLIRDYPQTAAAGRAKSMVQSPE